jgi:DNA modification methylase
MTSRQQKSPAAREPRSRGEPFPHCLIRVDEIRPNPRNSRTHSGKQIREIAASITAFGFTVPVLVDNEKELIAGHGRLEAAKSLGMLSVPAIVISGLSDAKKRALLLADNRIALNAGWDREQLEIELATLPDILFDEGLDISISGFAPAEIDSLHADFEMKADPSDDLDDADLSRPGVSECGDLWQLGKHRLLCGDARNQADLNRLLDGQRAHMAFLDPPYNVVVSNVVGRGATKYREFAMASGEMSSSQFVAFLNKALGVAAEVSHDGAVHFVCMDWRHIGELVAAGHATYGAMLNLIAWVKSNAGQGSFYRSQHELIGVFRVGAAPHLNTVELGRHGRNRSNVWQYSGPSRFQAGRTDDQQVHPTIKPVQMVADAIKDCTRRDEIVLDSFCGSGATLLAAERVGRRGRGLEIDPFYVDLAIRRWQSFTGKDAIHVASELSYEEISRRRQEGHSPSSRCLPRKRRGRR